jgi:hypothetical protein
MDGPRKDDVPRSANLADLESNRRAATDTAAAENESGVETIARIPVSRSVIIDERQQPLPASQATSTATTAPPTPAIDGPGTPREQAPIDARPEAARGVAPRMSPQTPGSGSAASADVSSAEATAPLFPEVELQQFRTRWDQVQASFVDDPRLAVQDADNLVASMVKRIAEQFAEQRAKLEGQWSRGDETTTEELRRSLRQYRAFFERLLSM